MGASGRIHSLFKGMLRHLWNYVPKFSEQPNLEISGLSWVLMAHVCNPSCSRDRDQEDCGSKPGQASSLRDPISKSPSQKRAGGVAQDVGLSSNPSTTIKKKIDKTV
jgi:hypothetical protein